jgi:bis(5'-nucleosidyl)-tetraphosphatase
MSIHSKRTDLSFGIVPFKKFEGSWRVLLVHHIAGHWSFPKGHPEKEEVPVQTAQRELREETGLHVTSLLQKEPIEELYTFSHRGEKIFKTVRYFVALVDGKEYPQLDELLGCEWFSFDDALKILSFENTRKLLIQAEKVLRTVKGE